MRTVLIAILLFSFPVGAQQIEPRAYANAPVGINFLIAGYIYTEGGVSLDPALPVEGAEVKSDSAILGYARTLDLWGNSGKISVILPYSQISGRAELAGVPQHRDVQGLGDTRLRLSMNFHGAPALTMPEFRYYEQDTVVGVSLEIVAPTGQYDSAKLLNIGTNRWSIRPELGVSQAFGDLTVELSTGATFYTDNDEFLGDMKRSQDPVFSTQGHFIYAMRSGTWLALTATYVTGGQTQLDGVRDDNRQSNWRAGMTIALPVDRNHSIKLFASTGVSTRTGADYDLIGAAWQYRWGGGF